jgi:hypothetical protein
MSHAAHPVNQDTGVIIVLAVIFILAAIGVGRDKGDKK